MLKCCHDSIMRTTVTIDPDTELLLNEEMRRSGRSFKQVLNLALRQALSRQRSQQQVKPIFSAAFPSDLEGQSMNRLADSLDDLRSIQEMGS